MMYLMELLMNDNVNNWSNHLYVVLKLVKQQPLTATINNLLVIAQYTGKLLII